MSSKALQNLLDSFKKSEPVYAEDEVIQINQVIGKAALIYEKVRNSMDYQEEHLLRKNALYRILKRKLFIEKILINQSEEKLAEQIVYEMIRAGYLRNNQVPKTKVTDVLNVIHKYHSFVQSSSLNQGEFMWMLELEACELEEVLVPDHTEKALTRYAFQVMNHRVISNNGEIDNKEKELQLYLAIERSIKKPDKGMLNYILWNLYYPGWRTADEALIAETAKAFSTIKTEIDQQLNHPWKKSLNKITRRWAIVFWTFRDIIEKDPGKASEIFANQTSLELAINNATTARYKALGKKLRRGVIRSIIYVFFTKMLLALVIEMPLDIYFKGVVDYFALGINVGFPPVLMFLVAITIRTPSKKNTEKIIKEVQDIVFERPNQQTFKLKAPRKRSFLINFLLNIMYLFVFVVCVYFIFKGLGLLDFMWFSSMIFVFFLSVVSFFGLRIRKPIKEITIVDKRDNIFTLLIDFLSLPFATIGLWASSKFSKVNIFAFVFDFIIEAPFKIFIEVLEDMFSFWREKKEDAYDQ